MTRFFGSVGWPQGVDLKINIRVPTCALSTAHADRAAKMGDRGAVIVKDTGADQESIRWPIYRDECIKPSDDFGDEYMRTTMPTQVPSCRVKGEGSNFSNRH